MTTDRFSSPYCLIRKETVSYAGLGVTGLFCVCQLCTLAGFVKMFLALRSRGAWGEDRVPPTFSSPGPTPFCPNNAKLLPTPLNGQVRLTS